MCGKYWGYVGFISSGPRMPLRFIQATVCFCRVWVIRLWASSYIGGVVFGAALL